MRHAKSDKESIAGCKEVQFVLHHRGSFPSAAIAPVSLVFDRPDAATSQNAGRYTLCQGQEQEHLVPISKGLQWQSGIVCTQTYVFMCMLYLYEPKWMPNETSLVNCHSYAKIIERWGWPTCVLEVNQDGVSDRCSASGLVFLLCKTDGCIHLPESDQLYLQLCWSEKALL